MSNKIKTILVFLIFFSFVDARVDPFKVYKQKLEDSQDGEEKAKEFTTDRQRFDQNWSKNAESNRQVEFRAEEDKDFISDVVQETEQWVIYLQSGKAFAVSLEEHLEEWQKFDRVRVRLTANPDAEVSIWNDLLKKSVFAHSI